MNILHISCSPRGREAESDRLARKIIGLLSGRYPHVKVVDREIGDGSLSHIDGNYALTQHSATAKASHTGGVATSDALIGELEAADLVVIGTPMHNMSIPSALKAWIDHVVRARRTFNSGPQGKVGTLRDRPVFVAVASGGRFSGERATQPDFLTPYLKTILGSIGLHDVNFFSVEGTGGSEEGVALARARTDRLLDAYFLPERELACASADTKTGLAVFNVPTHYNPGSEP